MTSNTGQQNLDSMKGMERWTADAGSLCMPKAEAQRCHTKMHQGWIDFKSIKKTSEPKACVRRTAVVKAGKTMHTSLIHMLKTNLWWTFQKKKNFDEQRGNTSKPGSALLLVSTSGVAINKYVWVIAKIHSPSGDTASQQQVRLACSCEEVRAGGWQRNYPCHENANGAYFSMG